MSRARLLGIAVVVVLLCAGLGLSAVMAQDEGEAAPAASAIEPNRPEYEPNDSLWEANGAELGMLWHGAIRPAGDVDFYRVYAETGMPVSVTIDMPPGSPLAPVVSLYDWNENLLDQVTCAGPGVCMSFVAGESTDYFFSVSDANGAGGRSYTYSLLIDLDDVYEPNDFSEQAALIAYEEEVWALFAPIGDIDFFSFVGMAGDELGIYLSNGNLTLYDADENEIVPQWLGDRLVYSLPMDGVYYIQARTDYCHHCPYTLSIEPFDRALFVSLGSSGAVGGVSFTSGDILRHWLRAGTWEMFFDASDVGLKGNLVAFDFANEPRLVYSQKQNVDGVGIVEPNDILSFSPYSLGEDTAGYLNWFLDGSDVGLTTSGEGIDALGHHSYAYSLLLSTSGKARVPYGAGQLTAGREDLLNLDVLSTGANSAGFWYPFQDGEFTLDVGGANLTGLDLEGNEFLYLSFDRTVTLDGVTLAAGDIALCHLVWYMAGCETVEKYFDASDAGLAGYKIDAFDLDYAYPYPYP